MLILKEVAYILFCSILFFKKIVVSDVRERIVRILRRDVEILRELLHELENTIERVEPTVVENEAMGFVLRSLSDLKRDVELLEELESELLYNINDVNKALELAKKIYEMRNAIWKKAEDLERLLLSL